MLHKAAGDVCGRGAAADIEGDRIIEVRAHGNSARVSGLWFESRQVHVADGQPDRFRLVMVGNVCRGEPEEFYVLDINGPALTALRDREREKHYFEVTSSPVSVYDAVVSAIP